MKAYRGDEAALVTFTVTDDMVAAFGGRVIHRVLATWSLVHHMEWAARKLLEPHLEPGEEGAGAGVNVRHLAPAPVGSVVEVRARVARAGPGTLVADVEALAQGRRLAEGQVFQAVWPRGELRRRMENGA